MHDDAASTILYPQAAERRAPPLAAALARQLVAERDRWFLWLPVALGLGIGLCFALPAAPSPLAGGAALVAALASLAFWLWQGRRLGMGAKAVLAVAIMLALGFGLAATRTLRVAAPVLERPGTYTVTGRIAAIEESAAGRRATLDRLGLDGVPAEATPLRVRVSLRRGGDLVPGTTVRLRARLQPPMGPAMPGAFDYARQAWFEQMGGLGYAIGAVEVLAPPEEDTGLVVATVRAHIADRITDHVPGDAGAVASALLTGVRAGISAQVWRDFQLSGLAHILSISGLHMVLVAGLVMAAVRYGLALIPPLALRIVVRKPAAAAAIVATFLYMLLAGGTVPTQRSFLMIAVALVGVIADRDPLSMRLLAVAALVVLAWHPEALFGASFQLSFAAVAALIAVYELAAARAVLRGGERQGVVRKAFGYVLGVAATTLIAGTATAPFAAFHFQTVPTYGVLANLLAVPVTSFWVMPAGLLAMLAMPLGLEAWPLAAMAWGIDGVLLVAHLTAELPGASVPVPLQPTALLILFAAGGTWLVLWRQRWRYLGVVPMVAALALALLHRPPDLLVSADLDQVAVRRGDGRVVMVEWQSDSLLRTAWLRGLGSTQKPVRPAPWAGPEGGLACDPAGCVLERAGIRVALARRADATREDCGRADLLVARYGRCAGPAHTLDWIALRDSGGIAVWLGRDLRIRRVTEERGRWPWVRQAKPRSGIVSGRTSQLSGL
ncbi:MAG: ComEC/Rec2 family competence protein [Geminicoccaceae bacterium]